MKVAWSSCIRQALHSNLTHPWPPRYPPVDALPCHQATGMTPPSFGTASLYRQPASCTSTSVTRRQVLLEICCRRASFGPRGIECVPGISWPAWDLKTDLGPFRHPQAGVWSVGMKPDLKRCLPAVSPQNPAP